MKKYLLVLLVTTSLASCSNEAGNSSMATSTKTQRSACDLLTKEQVREATGLSIIKVVPQDRGTFTSCSFETDDWMQTIGLIYFPGLGTPTSAAALAEEVKADLEGDKVDYSGLETDTSIGDAAVRYQMDDGAHYVIAHRDGHRVIVNGSTGEVATTLARLALAAIE